jgi:hypothetical protein
MTRREPRERKPRVWPLLPNSQEGSDALPPVLANLAMIPRGVKMGTTCVLHAHREWVPIEQHHVWPLGMGGPDIAANKISVCCNGHYSIHAVIDHHIRYGEDPPWELMQHFGPRVRERAWQGWDAAGRPRSN